MCRQTPKRKEIKKREATREDKTDLRWTMEEKERREEITEDHKKVEELVSKCFHKWIKVFGKVESKRMLVRKLWDYTIDLKEDFVPRKG